MDSMYSEKGKPLKVLEGFKFRRAKETQKGVVWRCTVKSCKVRLYTDDSESEVLELVNCHSHEPSSNIVREQISNSVKRKATSDIGERPLKIIRNEIACKPSEDTENLTKEDINAAQKAIYRARRSALPPLPKTIGDVHEALNSIVIR